MPEPKRASKKKPITRKLSGGKPESSPPENLPLREGEASEASADALSATVNQELYKRNAELAIRNKTLALLRKLDEISMATLGVDDMAHEITSIIAKELGY